MTTILPIPESIPTPSAINSGLFVKEHLNREGSHTASLVIENPTNPDENFTYTERYHTKLFELASIDLVKDGFTDESVQLLNNFTKIHADNKVVEEILITELDKSYYKPTQGGIKPAFANTVVSTDDSGDGSVLPVVRVGNNLLKIVEYKAIQLLEESDYVSVLNRGNSTDIPRKPVLRIFTGPVLINILDFVKDKLSDVFASIELISTPHRDLLNTIYFTFGRSEEWVGVEDFVGNMSLDPCRFGTLAISENIDLKKEGNMLLTEYRLRPIIHLPVLGKIKVQGLDKL